MQLGTITYLWNELVALVAAGLCSIVLALSVHLNAVEQGIDF